MRNCCSYASVEACRMVRAIALDAVLDDMISRCRELNLRAVGPEQKLVTNFIILLTAKTMHALFGPSRRKWIAL